MRQLRRVVYGEQQTHLTQNQAALGVQLSPRRPLGMPTGQARRASLLKRALLEKGVWSVTTAFRQFRKAARVAQQQRHDVENVDSVPTRRDHEHSFGSQALK